MSIQPDVVLAACPLCDKAIVKVDHVQACAKKIRNERRSFQLMSRNMAALIPKLPGGTPGIYDFGRAAGNAVCKKCGLEFIEHPKGMEEYLYLLCDGKQVKL